MLEWEKKLPNFDAKKWGLEKYLKGSGRGEHWSTRLLDYNHRRR